MYASDKEDFDNDFPNSAKFPRKKFSRKIDKIRNYTDEENSSMHKSAHDESGEFTNSFSKKVIAQDCLDLKNLVKSSVETVNDMFTNKLKKNDMFEIINEEKEEYFHKIQPKEFNIVVKKKTEANNKRLNSDKFGVSSINNSNHIGSTSYQSNSTYNNVFNTGNTYCNTYNTITSSLVGGNNNSNIISNANSSLNYNAPIISTNSVSSHSNYNSNIEKEINNNINGSFSQDAKEYNNTANNNIASSSTTNTTNLYKESKTRNLSAQKKLDTLTTKSKLKKSKANKNSTTNATPSNKSNLTGSVLNYNINSHHSKANYTKPSSNSDLLDLNNFTNSKPVKSKVSSTVKYNVKINTVSTMNNNNNISYNSNNATADNKDNKSEKNNQLSSKFYSSTNNFSALNNLQSLHLLNNNSNNNSNLTSALNSVVRDSSNKNRNNRSNNNSKNANTNVTKKGELTKKHTYSNNNNLGISKKISCYNTRQDSSHLRKMSVGTKNDKFIKNKLLSYNSINKTNKDLLNLSQTTFHMNTSISNNNNLSNNAVNNTKKRLLSLTSRQSKDKILFSSNIQGLNKININNTSSTFKNLSEEFSFDKNPCLILNSFNMFKIFSEVSFEKSSNYSNNTSNNKIIKINANANKNVIKKINTKKDSNNIRNTVFSNLLNEVSLFAEKNLLNNVSEETMKAGNLFISNYHNYGRGERMITRIQRVWRKYKIKQKFNNLDTFKTEYDKERAVKKALLKLLSESSDFNDFCLMMNYAYQSFEKMSKTNGKIITCKLILHYYYFLFLFSIVALKSLLLMSTDNNFNKQNNSYLEIKQNIDYYANFVGNTNSTTNTGSSDFSQSKLQLLQSNNANVLSNTLPNNFNITSPANKEKEMLLKLKKKENSSGLSNFKKIKYSKLGK